MAEHDLEVSPTGDGSFTLRRTDLDEPYHSARGALQESRHVFIDAGLSRLFAEWDDSTPVVLLEMGLGTGLNALLTFDFLKRHPGSLQLHYHALETRPLDWPVIDRLNYCRNDLAEYSEKFKRLHDAPWGIPVDLDERFKLWKWNASWSDPIELPPADLVYYDAFGPRVQPELWDESAMRRLAERLRPDGSMVTYCAQGAFKRALKAVGLQVIALPGPPGKREMIRAVKDI